MTQKFNPEIWQVERKPFNPEQWLDEPKKEKPKAQVAANYSNSIQHDVEIVVQRLEESQLDLTCDQSDWVKMGFAFASEFGEAGRSFFHRICHFYPGYDYADCDRQFDKCLKDNKPGATIKSFFWAAKQAGITISVKSKS